MPAPVSIRYVRFLLITFFALTSLYYIFHSYSDLSNPPMEDPFPPDAKESPPTPPEIPVTGKFRQTGRTKAAFVTLTRNFELWDLVNSIRQIEDRFNWNYHYPWVFLNDVPFTDEFISVTSKLVSGGAKYGNQTLQWTMIMFRSRAERALVYSELD